MARSWRIDATGDSSVEPFGLHGVDKRPSPTQGTNVRDKKVHRPCVLWIFMSMWNVEYEHVDSLVIKIDLTTITIAMLVIWYARSEVVHDERDERDNS
jgi:hypothetical protein